MQSRSASAKLAGRSTFCEVMRCLTTVALRRAFMGPTRAPSTTQMQRSRPQTCNVAVATGCAAAEVGVA